MILFKFYTASITTVKQAEVWFVLKKGEHLGAPHAVGVQGAWDR
jgi:hypothetical protein